MVERYYQGIAHLPPYSYWVWADVAAFLIACGPAVVAGIRRTAAVTVHTGPKRALLNDRLALIVLAAVVVVVFADVSGLSKAEVERIWLPCGVWLLPATALPTGFSPMVARRSSSHCAAGQPPDPDELVAGPSHRATL